MKANLLLLAKVLKASNVYSLKQINIVMLEDSMIVYSTGNTDSLHFTSLHSTVELLSLSCYASYDQDLNKVVLNIF